MTVKPRNTARDAEIVRLRDSDKNRWTWPKLAREFEMTVTAVRSAYYRIKKGSEDSPS
jgi:hypothetical protein